MEIDEKKEYQKVTSAHMKGFTTIEMIIVVVVVGIMAAIALPKLGNTINSVDLYSAARQVKSDIRYTQEAAMSRYRKTTITFTSNSDTYTITARGYSESKELPARSRATFNAIGSGTTELVYTFNSSGEPDSTYGAGDTLRISSGSSYKDIVVSDVTGRAAIQ